jgi:hypothetical protein
MRLFLRDLSSTLLRACNSVRFSCSWPKDFWIDFGPRDSAGLSAGCSATAIAFGLTVPARSVFGARKNSIQQKDFMKYLLVIIAAMSMLGSASAIAPSADCCAGACCKGHAACCKK